MQKQTIQVLAVLALLVIGANVAIFWVFSSQPDDDEASQTVPALPIPENPGSLSVGGVAGAQSEASPSLGGSTSPQDADPNNSGQTASEPVSLPEPSEFSQYEEFANSTSTQFIDVVEGNGAIADSGNTVFMLYKGWLTNGDLFDQNKVNEQGQIEAFSFQLGAGRVIPGWDQGIAGMREGGQRRLIIPSQFAYGEAGIEGRIPPNSMLIFDVELVKVEGL